MCSIKVTQRTMRVCKKFTVPKWQFRETQRFRKGDIYLNRVSSDGDFRLVRKIEKIRIWRQMKSQLHDEANHMSAWVLHQQNGALPERSLWFFLLTGQPSTPGNNSLKTVTIHDTALHTHFYIFPDYNPYTLHIPAFPPKKAYCWSTQHLQFLSLHCLFSFCHKVCLCTSFLYLEKQVNLHLTTWWLFPLLKSQTLLKNVLAHPCPTLIQTAQRLEEN